MRATDNPELWSRLLKLTSGDEIPEEAIKIGRQFYGKNGRVYQVFNQDGDMVAYGSLRDITRQLDLYKGFAVRSHWIGNEIPRGVMKGMTIEVAG